MGLEAGSVIAGRYRVVRVLGKGGMGTVVLAEQTDLGRSVALKILSPDLTDDPTALERLRREAQSAASLSHPNVAQVYALEEKDGVVALAMEHVEGKPLRAILEVEGRLTVERAVRIARQMLQGLGAAHAASIVHRDVKPENVLVAVDDRGRDQVKLVDFGIAKQAGTSKLTQHGMVIGTPSYLAPEQVRGEEADARSDLWAVGIVLYEMLAGHRPFRADDTQKLLRAIATETPELLSDVCGAPEHVSAAVDRALRKDPGARHQSAKEMLSSLEPPKTDAPPSTKKERPKPASAAAAAPPTASVAASAAGPAAVSAPAAASAPARSNAPWLIGLVVLGAAASVSLYFRYVDVGSSPDAAPSTTASAPIPTASGSGATEFADTGPLPSVVMTIGEDSDADIDPIAERAEDVARCLKSDRTCFAITHSRGAVVAAMPEEDDEVAAQCIVSALEGAHLDESTPTIVRVCITRTR